MKLKLVTVVGKTCAAASLWGVGGKKWGACRERECARHVGVTHGVPLEHRVSAAVFTLAIDRREM